MMPQRHLAAGAKECLEAGDQRQVVEGGVDLGGRQDFHENGPRVTGAARSGATKALWRSIAF